MRAPQGQLPVADAVLSLTCSPTRAKTLITGALKSASAHHEFNASSSRHFLDLGGAESRGLHIQATIADRLRRARLRHRRDRQRVAPGEPAEYHPAASRGFQEFWQAARPVLADTWQRNIGHHLLLRDYDPVVGISEGFSANGPGTHLSNGIRASTSSFTYLAYNAPHGHCRLQVA